MIYAECSPQSHSIFVKIDCKGNEIWREIKIKEGNFSFFLRWQRINTQDMEPVARGLQA